MDHKRWRQIVQRISRMDRAELRDRLRQEFASRQDALLGRVGYDFARNSVRLDGGSARFFLEPSSIDSILALLRERIPGRAEEIVQQADQISQHRFDLLGYAGLDYGDPIDWHLDAVHKKRAPRKAFYKVRYLDFSEVGDSKVTWELNRHQHLVTLAKAYRLTGNRGYADEALRQWRHWWAENPYPIGINWASSLEAAFRSLSWLWSYHMLQGAADVPDLRKEWLRGLAVHGRHIERHLSTYFSPNTHLLGEGVALFFLGVLCPELAAAGRWKALGKKIVLEEAERQVRPDGFHFEQSTYYHVYALDFFLHFAVLARLNGVQLPGSFEVTVEKMLTALCLLGRGGAVPRFGDDDGGRLFDPQRNCAEHLLDPLATGAILFHRGDYKKAAASLREETLWLLGADGVRKWDELSESLVSNEAAALPDAGFYLLPSGNDTQLVVDAGPLGTQSGGHGHADALSVCLVSHARPLLIDPGTYEYVGPGPERNLFRGTGMHNTLRVDGADQAQPATPFSWERLTQTKVERWIQGKSFDLVVASHDGYEKLVPPAVHQRSVVSLRNGIYLIRDIVHGQGKRRLDISWHLGPELEQENEVSFRRKDSAEHLALLPADGRGWKRQVREEAWTPAYGSKSPMTVVNFSAEIELPTEFAVLLVTWGEARRTPGVFTLVSQGASDEGVRGYRYSEQEMEYVLSFGTRGRPRSLEPLTSDAEFICWCRQLDGSNDHLMLCGGSFAKVNGGSQLRCSRVVEWAELTVTADGSTAFASDMGAIEHASGVGRTTSTSSVVQ